MPRRRVRKFIAIEPDRTTKWSCTIKGIDITDFILLGVFPHGLIAEELICRIDLDNSGEDFTDKFSARDAIVFKMDFTNGTTIQFEGEVEEVRSKIESGFFKLAIKGAHFTAQSLDVMVTEDFQAATISDIRTSLISTYLPDFTSNNVTENTKTISIKFVNKPLLDCLIAIDIEADEDSYFDFDKDLHSFKKGTIENTNIHFTHDGSIITLRGLGTDSAEVRNKVTVYGEAGGLPVISTSDDLSSQSTFRIKESVIQDTTIVDEVQAQSLGDAESAQLKDPVNQGIVESLLWTNVNPGDKAYVISPPHNVHDLFRIVKFSFMVPFEKMEVFFNKERSIPKLFKDRIRKDQAQESIINPNRMTHSFNFGSEGGFNINKIDAPASNATEIVDGKLKLVAGNETGNMVSVTKETPVEVNFVHILAIGELTDQANFYVNADGTNNWQLITLGALVEVDTGKRGKKLRLRIEMTDTGTRIPSAVVLYKE